MTTGSTMQRKLFDTKPELPLGWEYPRLGEIVAIKYGKGLPTKNLLESGYPVFGANGVIGFHKEYLYEDEQVLISCRGAYSGKINWSPAKCFVTNNSLVLEAPKGQEDIRKYLFYALQAIDRSKLVTGSAQPQVTINNAEVLRVPIAPKDQQQRIVAEIEKQFSRLDEAVASLKRTKANLKRYKASVLKAAVEGKLTEEWRLSARAASRKRAQASELETIPKAGKDKWFIYIIECNDGSYYVGHTADLHARWQAHCEGNGADWTRQHPPKYLVHFEECGSREDAVKREQDLKTGFGRTWRKREIDVGRMKPLVHNPANETAKPVHDEDMQTGSKLFERILAERRAKWAGRGKYKEPAALDTTNLLFLPKGWAWATFEQVSSRVTVGHVGPMKHEYIQKGVPFLRSQNIRENKFDPEGLLYIPRDFHTKLSKSLIHPGDLAVVRSGSVGVTCVIPETLGEANCADLVLIQQPHGLVPQFGAYYMNSLAKRRVEAGKVGVALTHLNTKSVAAMPVPVPPLNEQQRIVAEVERRLSVVEGLEATVEANLTRADRLRQSILGKAFSGKLLFNRACV